MEAALFKVIRYCRSQRKLAKLLGVKPDKISYWVNHAKTIPFEYALAMEELTNGLVSRYELAPYARRQLTLLSNKKDNSG